MKKHLLQLGFFLILFSAAMSQQLIQGTIKKGAGASDIEVWFKPNFSNNTQYLFQIGMPIAFPASASPVPTGLTVTLDPGFVAVFGNNYSVTVNPVAHNSANTEKYFNIVLVRNGAGASTAQTWTSGVEFKVLTASFVPSTSPASQVKLADYQDGGSDGQGNFYTQDGNNNYYVTSTSIGNFYAASAQSTVGGDASAGYAQTISAVPPSICTAPSAPVVTGITTTAAAINWAAVSGVAGYEYAVTNSATPPASGTATTGTTYNASGLTPATQYYAHLRSSCGGSSFSAWASTPFTTQNPSCTAPAAPVVSNITTTSADVNWSVVGGVLGYEYAITASSTPPSSGTATTGTTYSALGLATGTTYYAHVRSSCGAGLFSSWVSTSFTTDCAATSVPVVSNIAATAATIDWTAVGAGATGYEYVVTTSSTAPVSAGIATTATTYNATGLSPGTLYYIYVRTACTAGVFSSWQSSSFTTLCPSTVSPVVTNIMPTSATVSWTAISGVVGYEYAVTTSATPPASGTATTFFSINKTGLTPGTSYYIHVRSSCSAGIFSAWASAAFATPYPPCLAPSTPVVTNISNGVNISWIAVSGVAGYEYVVSTSAITPSSGTATTATSYQATGLSSLTPYYVYVRSNCGAGGYSQWVSKAFTTSCLPPPVITGTVNGNSADMVWNKVNGAISYEYALTTYLDPPVSGIVISDTTQHLANLSLGVAYYFQVRTNCGAGGVSEWSTYAFHTPGLEAFPNPVGNSLIINLYGLNGSNGQLSLFDAAGKLLRKIVLVNNTVTVDTRGFAAGIYMIRYVDGDNRFTVKVLKE